MKSAGSTWTESREFSDSMTVTVAPNHAGWVESELPILDTTGDFIIKSGDTRWILEGASSDSPDPHRTQLLVHDRASRPNLNGQPYHSWNVSGTRSTNPHIPPCWSVESGPTSSQRGGGRPLRGARSGGTASIGLFHSSGGGATVLSG